MDQDTLLPLELLSIALCNIVAVYIAAISYSLPWKSIVTVMVLFSVITAIITPLLLSKMTKQDISRNKVQSITSTLFLSVSSFLAIFMILSYRFTIPMAIGMSLLSCLLTSFISQLIK